jgi:hypothetical protein
MKGEVKFLKKAQICRNPPVFPPPFSLRVCGSNDSLPQVMANRRVEIPAEQLKATVKERLAARGAKGIR